MRRAIRRTPSFLRTAKPYFKHDAKWANAIRDAIVLLEEDAFDPRLGTHKLKSRLQGVWASSAGYDLRILFEIDTSDSTEVIVLLAVGTHDEVY